MSKRWLILPLLVLYLSMLGSVGLLSKDEPRYAAIGREMAHSGDWITPRLDGSPWFEKPPLLYWAVGLGHVLHLSDEWAARLPLALMSAAFLIYFFYILQRECSSAVALIASGILATCAGWIAYSFVAVPDLPMSAALGAAVLIALYETHPRAGWASGALLGLAILAKGFVPVVLIAPVFLVAKGKRIAMAAAAVVVAAPWYTLCYARNGALFWDEFFWKHHVDRFLHPDLEHVQPWYFYLPVILAGLFPWTPMLALLGRARAYRDPRARWLLVYALFGLAFFSRSMNKLPGYVLPLLPAVAILIALSYESLSARAQAWWLAACTALLVVIPTIAAILPQALLVGITHVQVSYGLALPFALAAVAVFALAWTGRPQSAAVAAMLAVACGILYLKYTTFPVLDRQYSVRAFWRADPDRVSAACLDNVRREWEYGLNYYAGHPLPHCQLGISPRISVIDGHLFLLP